MARPAATSGTAPVMTMAPKHPHASPATARSEQQHEDDGGQRRATARQVDVVEAPLTTDGTLSAQHRLGAPANPAHHDHITKRVHLASIRNMR